MAHEIGGRATLQAFVHGLSVALAVAAGGIRSQSHVLHPPPPHSPPAQATSQGH
jgi:hypothetical protein